MITLLCGENDYELTKKVAQLKHDFDGEAERYDGDALTREQLADLFAGQTLFSMKRLVIIDDPSACGDLWQDIATWAARLSDDTQLVLVEPKPDKRTATYKWLKKNAEVQEFTLIDERDTRALLGWVDSYASDIGLKLTAQQQHRIVDRAGANQWELAHALDKLSLIESVTEERIDDVIEASASESVFALFETALNGDVRRLNEMLTNLRMSEDAYRLFGLINSQALQLVALTYGGGDPSKVAADIGAKSAYPLQKLAPFARRISRTQASRMVQLLAAADMRIKSSDADPWLVLESTLAQIASLVSE